MCVTYRVSTSNTCSRPPPVLRWSHCRLAVPSPFGSINMAGLCHDEKTIAAFSSCLSPRSTRHKHKLKIPCNIFIFVRVCVLRKTPHPYSCYTLFEKLFSPFLVEIHNCRVSNKQVRKTCLSCSIEMAKKTYPSWASDSTSHPPRVVWWGSSCTSCTGACSQPGYWRPSYHFSLHISRSLPLLPLSEPVLWGNKHSMF